VKRAGRLRREVLLRIAADAVMVNTSYFLAFATRFLFLVAFTPEGVHLDAPARFRGYLATYASTFWLLNLVAVAVFYLSGFYTFGRAYRGRYKVLVIVQAVSLAYLIFGFGVYFSYLEPLPPRGVLVLGWAITLAALTASRLWAWLWGVVIKAERHLLREYDNGKSVRNVLVIGGAGYVGSVLCRHLLSQGYSVRVLDALLYGHESLGGLVSHPRFELLEGDSRDVSDVIRALLDMDAVVHLGELVGDPACALDEHLTLEINLAATRMVAEAARGYGIKRFVYASSCSVYGTGEETLNERSFLNPVSLYARAKTGSEQMLLALNGPDFHPVILRLATVYGLSPRPRFDLVVNLLAAKAVRDGEITIYGGDQWRPFVHVADVAYAIVRCLGAPLVNVKGQVFNVGSDEQNRTIAQVGELIRRLIPEARLVLQGQDVDRRNYRVSFAKIRRELDFLPRHTIEDGVREIEAALRNGQIGDFRDRRYSNYKTLSDPDNHLSIRSHHINKLYEPSLNVVDSTILDMGDRM
jgi:nucleoside-diphosphate-sugar epimerase